MDLHAYLIERMARPQRHRLLQGFPAVPAMVPAVPVTLAASGAPTSGRLHLVRQPDGALVDWLFRRGRNQAVDRSAPPLFTLDPSRDLIVGVIPHTQCVPRKEGCGFCTFPHDAANARDRRVMIDAVIDEISQHAQTESLHRRRVGAIYIGGGTANLSDPDDVTRIVRALQAAFVIDEAELSLEGTPHLFERLLSSHLTNLAAQPTATKRISLGIQTFDESFLRMMGRERFGGASLVKKLVKRARALSIATSGDLLFNLPGQQPAQMDHDVDVALACGLDQICLYNLVLYEGLGTPWSQDPALVAQMRASRDALAQWLRLRERLLAAGYVQTTLTNFERQDVVLGAHRFRYERASFSIERTDGLGVGPLSLSTFIDVPQRGGVKLMRRKDLRGPPWSREDLMFLYDADTLPVLAVTRGLAKTRLDGATYRNWFGRALADDLAAPLAACAAAGLVAIDGDDVALTPEGMFYADAVVSTLAAGRLRMDGAGVHTRDLLREQPRAQHYVSMG